MTTLSATLTATLRRALTAHRAAEWAQAAADYETILQADSDHHEVLQLLGTVRFETGDFASAEDLLRRAIALKPLDPAPYVSLAMVLRAAQRYKDALAPLDHALELQPAVPDVLVMRGNVLQELGHSAPALADFNEVLRLRPDDPAALNNRGNLLRHFNRQDEALADYDRAISLRPDFAEAHSNRGNALRELNRIDDAREAYRRAVELAPQTVRFHRNLASVTRLTREAPAYLALDAFSQREDALEPQDRVALHFALGDALTSFGEHEEAFAHFVQGNALQRTRTRYDEVSVLAHFASLRKTVTRDYIEARRGGGDPSDSPVFVIGMPRSGSTLIEQVLASHPDVYGAGEYPAFAHAFDAVVAQHYAAKNDDAFLRAITPGNFTEIGQDYLRQIQTLGGLEHGYRRVVDKTLFNFVNLGLIHLALPNARFIHARRSAVETCLSCFSKLLLDVPFSFDLGELGRYFSAYDRLMEHWRSVLPEGVLLEVQYENMVSDLPVQVEQILAHCGLEWNAACLDFHQSKRPVATASSLQVRQPIYTSSLRRWHPAPEQLAPLMAGFAQGR